MKKVTDFNNTWCEATEEAREKLSKFSHPELIEEEHGEFQIYYDLQNKRQIQLVDGEFYYADSIEEDNNLEPECQFAKYGFEKPEFECEIAKEYDRYFLGMLKDESWSELVPCIWDKEGAVVTPDWNEIWCSKYSLAPLKKEWYENENNFPCLVKSKEGYIFQAQKYENGYIIGSYNCKSVEEIELPSKEEVLSLCKETK